MHTTPSFSIHIHPIFDAEGTITGHKADVKALTTLDGEPVTSAHSVGTFIKGNQTPADNLETLMEMIKQVLFEFTRFLEDHDDEGNDFGGACDDPDMGYAGAFSEKPSAKLRPKKEKGEQGCGDTLCGGKIGGKCGGNKDTKGANAAPVGPQEASKPQKGVKPPIFGSKAAQEAAERAVEDESFKEMVRDYDEKQKEAARFAVMLLAAMKEIERQDKFN